MRKLFLIDGSNHAFRVQYALPAMNASDGFPTRALYGFTTLFAKVLREHEPDYCAVAFDKGKTFRHEMFAGYKADRTSMPEDLRQQWPHFARLVSAFGYPYLAVDGYEADDVIGTLARRFASDDVAVYLVTGDKDFCQLVDDRIHILDLMKDTELGPPDVVERWGVPPEHIVDVLGLAGDTSDNIPGVPGVGPKKAARYVQKYGDLESVIAHAKDVGGKTGQAILEHAENARISRRLAVIDTQAPVDLELEDLAPKGLQEELLRELFDLWDFGKVARRLLGEQPAIDTGEYRTIRTEPDLDAVLAACRKAERVGFAFKTVGSDPRSATIEGASVAWDRTAAVYVPLHGRRGALDRDVALRGLAALLADPAVPKVAPDAKDLLHVCRAHGMPVASLVGDVRLLDYVLSAHEQRHGLDAVASRVLAHSLVDVSEPGASEQLFFDADDALEQEKYGAEAGHLAWTLDRRLGLRLDDGTRHVYEQIEMPLVPILAAMEQVGIGVDLGRLAALNTDFEERVAAAERRCWDIVGRQFNVNSRHELRDILFEELKLPPSKKVKDGWSTDSSVLEGLVDQHPLPEAVVAYRELAKLLSTYIKALPDQVERDGRIHTSFNQAVAATGRLSSNNPNLQNIPIRTEEGRRIRECFVPSAGCKFLSADYSQIELRIVAHFVGDGPLSESFARGEDIHARTSSEVFGVPFDEVTIAQRSAAKAINYGLIYGMSAFRLARDLQISRGDAERYIEEYFARMSGVRDWLEATKESAHTNGWVRTMFGRRRVLQDIHSKQYNLRAAAEREAVNTPVQGTAADIVKIAMLRVDEALKSGGFAARILLQVHDELLLEVPDGELYAVTSAVVHAMSTAADLTVPLVVNTAVGDNWNEAHG